MRPIDADLATEHVKKTDLSNREKIALLLCLASIPTIAPPPNDPLTLDQLREMDGEPVWIIDTSGGAAYAEYWAFIFSVEEGAICFSTKESGDDSRLFSLYGTGWLAYRRKPEGG